MTLYHLLVALLALPALAAFSVFTTAPAITTSTVQKDTTVRARPGVFIRDTSGSMIPLRIRSLDVSVDVKGAMATTTFDITVFNPHERVLEGEFSFPLSDGQTVARFALDINGRLREGVVVSKTKGRETFESVIRQRVDPALLEWTADNAFRTRIYPLPAKGTRRIVIAYEQPLTGTSDGFTYRMPFAYAQRIDTFRLRAMVAGFGVEPSLAGDGGDTVAFSPRGRDFLAELVEHDIDLNGHFTLTVPVQAGRHYSAVATHDGTSYAGMFLSAPRAKASDAAASINEISLVVDASMSGASRDHARERAFLDAMFKRLGTVKVHLVTFAHRPLSTKTLSVVDGDWRSVRMALDEIDHDGATQLGAVPFDKMRGQRIVLLSDGISTFGRHDPSGARVPVLCVTSGVTADYDVLRGIAQRSGGRMIDLTSLEIDDIAPNLFASSPMITEVNVLDGSVDQVRPQLPINASGMTSLAAVMRSASATVEVVTSLNGRALRRDTIRLAANEAKGASMARLWAQLELQRLNMDRRRNAAAIEVLGKQFTIVTPGTSLIVLDRIEDYVTHRITPPASEPDLVAEYMTRVSSIKRDSAHEYKEHFDRVVTLFQERQTWYGKTFTPVLRKQKINEEEVRAAPRQYSSPTSLNELASPLPPPSARRDRNAVRGSRTETHVQVDGLAVTDQFTGGLGNAAANIAADMPSPFADDARPAEPARKGVIVLSAPKDRAAYVDELASLSGSTIYARYLELRQTHGTSTAFYIDVADLLREKGDTTSALRVLSNLAELRGEDAPTLRILGYRLRQLGSHDLAVMVFEDVLRVREEEPQSYRDLGLALADAGRLQDACDRLYQLVLRPWDTRFPEVELIALHELNRIAAGVGAGKVSTTAYDARLIKDMPVGMRVVLSWDADNCDMDLWVTDPNGEKCFYSNRDTEIGGRLSRDLTGGYGPEEFILKAPIKGTYTVQVHYYGDRQQRLAGPTTIHVDLALHEGTRAASRRALTTRVEGVQKVVDIGSFTIE